MNIGVDIDGVLTDIEQFQIDYSSKLMYEKYNKQIKNNLGYYTSDLYDEDRKIDDEFWDKYREDYTKNYRSRDFSSEIIKKLKELGHNIIIITARGSELKDKKEKEKSNNIAINWLQKNNIIYDKIEFTVGSKLDYCIKNNIDVMIEDKPDNIIDIASKVPVYCFHATYNNGCVGHNITRVFSWYDILAKIVNRGDK